MPSEYWMHAIPKSEELFMVILPVFGLFALLHNHINVDRQKIDYACQAVFSRLHVEGTTECPISHCTISKITFTKQLIHERNYIN